MTHGLLTAEVISCPGRLGDMVYHALQINVSGFASPYVLTLALPAIGARALAAQADPAQLYRAISDAINHGLISIDIAPPEAA